MSFLSNWLRRLRGLEGEVGMDMGDGRVLAAEDVLDGYSARLLANRRRYVPRTVPVRVENDLSAAITVMAPELAPLANLAKQVAVALPAVEPEPAFRRNLSEALERTHRQNRIQEALGTRRRVDDRGGARVYVWVILTVAVCLSAYAGWRIVRRKA